MGKKFLFKPLTGVLLALFLLLPSIVPAEESPQKGTDQAFCAKMIQHGQEAYQRGKYLDAKEYFRKALQADPSSVSAWTYYDQAVIFALAEKVEKNANLIMPDTSSRSEQPGPAPTAKTPPPPPKSKAKKKPAFVIVEDEGC